METFKHVSNTWLVAQLIHPAVFYLYLGIIRGEWQVAADVLFYVVLFGFVFSIAGYLLCIFSFALVTRIKLSTPWKFCIWLFLMSSSVVAGIFLTTVIVFGPDLFSDIGFAVATGNLAAVLSALVRFRQFVDTIGYLSQNSFTV